MDTSNIRTCPVLPSCRGNKPLLCECGQGFVSTQEQRRHVSKAEQLTPCSNLCSEQFGSQYRERFSVCSLDHHACLHCVERLKNPQCPFCSRRLYSAVEKYTHLQIPSSSTEDREKPSLEARRHSDSSVSHFEDPRFRVQPLPTCTHYAPPSIPFAQYYSDPEPEEDEDGSHLYYSTLLNALLHLIIVGIL
ncbi:hypothetical protein RCL1_000142 [Eukaryota sp. TZLM3-RCL]